MEQNKRALPYSEQFKKIQLQHDMILKSSKSFSIRYFVHLLGAHGGIHEKRLLHHLLDNYNVLERPVANESDPLQLSFGLTLMQIIDVVSMPNQIARK